jgi:hypothetical protein
MKAPEMTPARAVSGTYTHAAYNEELEKRLIDVE